MDTSVLDIILGSIVSLGPIIAWNVYNRKKHPEERYEPTEYSGPADCRAGNPWRIGRSFEE